MAKYLSVNRFLSSSLAAAAVLLTGCTTPVPIYSPAGKNILALRGLPANVEAGQISGTQKSASCRLQPIGPQNEATFASYIQKSINEEVIIAGPSHTGRKAIITGALNSISVDCGIISGSWTIDMNVSVNDQPPFQVITVHPFNGNYIGIVVLARANTAFVTAIQDVVNNIISHPNFIYTLNLK